MVLVKRRVIRLASAATSGLLLTFAFPCIGWDWLAWCALLPLLLAIDDLPPGASFGFGFLAGLVHFCTLLYWFVPFLTEYGPFAVSLSAAILLLFAAYLALYMALFAATVRFLAPLRHGHLFWIPATWVALEFLRATLLTGFPWELLGHSQFKRLPIIQISDIVGVYGISFLIVLSNTALFQMIRFLARSKPRGLGRTIYRPFFNGMLCLLVIGGAWYYGSSRIRMLAEIMAGAPVKRVAVVQGNIDQSQKWDAAHKRSTIAKYARLSRSTQSQHPELIVWPETAMPFYFLQERQPTKRVFREIADISADFIIGSPAFVRQKEQTHHYNRAFLIAEQNTVADIYDKAHLVPYGEYVPLKQWLPFLGKMVAQVGDFSRGTVGHTLSWRGKHIGVMICYEQIFAYLARAAVRNGADFLVNMTNDAWYGRTAAPYQHFSMAIFRAVENRRSLVRSANTGISGFVDPIGRVMLATPIFVERAPVQSVPLMTAKTLYTRFGDVFAALCGLIVLFAGAWRLFSARFTKH